MTNAPTWHPLRDGSTHIQDVLASYLHSGRRRRRVVFPLYLTGVLNIYSCVTAEQTEGADEDELNDVNK